MKVEAQFLGNIFLQNNQIYRGKQDFFSMVDNLLNVNAIRLTFDK